MNIKGRHALVVALIVLPLVVALPVSFFSDSTLPTLILLVLEPLIWVGFAAGTLAFIVQKKWAFTMACFTGWVIFAAGVRWPVSPATPPSGPTATILAGARGCVASADVPSKDLRVVTWNANGHANTPAASADALALNADLLVLQEVEAAFVENLAKTVGGDWVYVELTPKQGVGLVVKDGTFLRGCGFPNNQNYVSFDLPASADRRSEAVLALAEVRGGILPILAMQMDVPGTPVELMTWGRRIKHGAARLSHAVQALDASAVVVAGNTNTHGTFRRFESRMSGPDLETAPAKATWPARLFGIRTLPLYHVDRAWFGPHWRLYRVETARLAESNHLALITDLEPT